MKIALSGYGKMGKEIEKIAVARGHEIVLRIDAGNTEDLNAENLRKADVCIEFSTPETAVPNIMACFGAGIPVVVGTTGWLDQLEDVKTACIENNQTLFYTSNYSIGVNLMFQVNRYLAKLMNAYPEYEVKMEEIHHIHKKDAPSGTAISLATQIIDNVDRKEIWVMRDEVKPNEILINAKREDEVPGTHTVTWTSAVDRIDITHTAFSRQGFALGAVVAAEWVQHKKGIFGMEDLMNK